jgi:hypothetical protein
MKWISVKQKLPDVGYDKKYPNASNNVLLTNGIKTIIGFYELCWCDSFTELPLNKFNVTHWMLLPEPPKQD